jgi:DNA-directed RNA polymerase subunit RPC12/RpoP
MVRVVKSEPHPSVVKEVICSNCGATLEYIPKDIKQRIEGDYTGGSDQINFIECPQCSHEIVISRW